MSRVGCKGVKALVDALDRRHRLDFVQIESGGDDRTIPESDLIGLCGLHPGQSVLPPISVIPVLQQSSQLATG